MHEARSDSDHLSNYFLAIRMGYVDLVLIWAVRFIIFISPDLFFCSSFLVLMSAPRSSYTALVLAPGNGYGASLASAPA